MGIKGRISGNNHKPQFCVLNPVFLVSRPNISNVMPLLLIGGVPYPGWNEWKVVYELKVNKYRMPQPEHVSDEL